MDILIKLIAKCDEKEEYFSFVRTERARFGASVSAGRKKVALEQNSRKNQAVTPYPRYGSASARENANSGGTTEHTSSCCWDGYAFLFL